ncbi:hypothetical protein LB535_10195 [Mesorhizobium sp. CA10]|uniref:hypothetical protein n=1 Tax=Mesorhizobium sp. CA10 TaxID=588495 RepID=UPI001CCED96A|nr:hypothetical protein [Mesorhizobium sp. CA10]MBZ9882723.1 hypothetical protein [Mesorhizobium sp. CA10]
MKKSLLSAVGLAFALAVSMPVLSPNDAAAATKPAPAATAATSSAPASDAMTMKKAKKHVTRACKATKKHKCPVKHRRSAAKKAY